LTREDDREEEKMNCLSIQREGKTIDLYTKEREGKLHADCQSRVPVPSPPPQHGGRRGRWGQARQVGQTRQVGAGEADGDGKPPASCPSPPASKTKEATGPNP